MQFKYLCWCMSGNILAIALKKTVNCGKSAIWNNKGYNSSLFSQSTIQKSVIFYYALYVLLTVLDPDMEKCFNNWWLSRSLTSINFLNY